MYLIRKGNSFRAVSAICTHLGCTVNRNANGVGFHCPCHGSQFNDNGVVTGGPAPKPLPWFLVSLSRDGRLVIDTAERSTRTNTSWSDMLKRLWDKFRGSRVGRSIFRVGLPSSNLERAQAAVSSFVLHVQPAKVNKRTLKFSTTLGLGADLAVSVYHPRRDRHAADVLLRARPPTRRTSP